MAAFDVVGIDFELGLGVDCRARAEHQITAELVRVGLLCARADRYAALKGAMGASGCHPFEHFVGLAPWRRMVDRGQNVRFLTA